MKKLSLVFALFAVAYFVAGACAWIVLPTKIAEAERNHDGVVLALTKLTGDQLAVSRRISEITAQTLDQGRDKVEQVSMLLGDSTLNRMALTYMGEDWSVKRSGFVGKVKQLREHQREQAKKQKEQIDQLEKKIEKIEYRKRQLLRNMNTPRDSAHRHKEEQWKEEIRDFDRQLSMLRDNSLYRDRLANSNDERDDAGNAASDGKVAVYEQASTCEAQTVGRLVKVMAEKAAALGSEKSEASRLRSLLALFDIWPLNKLGSLPTKD